MKTVFVLFDSLNRHLLGAYGGKRIPTPNFDVSTYNVPFYFAMLCVLAVSLLASWYVRGSKLGLALLAVRDDEDRARGLGVQTSFAASGRTTSRSSIRNLRSTRW